MSSNRIKIVVRRGLRTLAQSKAPAKEKKRFKDIYNTVYRHARSKGQNHKQALDYCWNVYASQSPTREKAIIKDIMSENMNVDRKQIRRMLLEMLEGEVISMSDYRAAETPAEPGPETEEGPQTEYESFLSDIHLQMLNFMEDNFETLAPEQQVFLDEMMDMLEAELGIEEEASFDFGEDEDEVIADVEDED